MSPFIRYSKLPHTVIAAFLIPLLFIMAVRFNTEERSTTNLSNTFNTSYNLIQLNSRHFDQVPSNFDPTTLNTSPDAEIVEQLFIGLVDIDDESGEARPELATSWTVSPDKTLYTFTLRTDSYWTDGNLVTAQDVRYGILRALDPTTGSSFAYVLHPIKNALDYYSGTLTDPNQVGITVIDDATLQIELEQPAAQILAILGMWMTRPLPQWTIETYGEAWTEPDNIVTNGAYQLTEWIPDEYVLLSKNPSFFEAEDVQIEQVKIWMKEEADAWQMYLDGELDSAEVPINASLDAATSQGVSIKYTTCTFYFGLNVARPPLDNVLVRKALVAATDRSLLTSGALSRSQQPAQTYTPPGLWGHGEDAGIPYNPAQARNWLSEAGYPNGDNLPPIILTISESSWYQYIAETLINNWSNVLGINVTLEILPFSDYIDRLFNGELQIWRNAWCSDYPDTYNYLKEGISPLAFGNWSNASYSVLLEQATQEANVSIRDGLLQQAETILVEEDVVMLPLYHTTSSVATRAYLQRIYAVFQDDIASWQLNQTDVVIDTIGGSLVSPDGKLSINVPAGTFTDTVVLTVRPAYGMPPDNPLMNTTLTYEIFATFVDTGQPAFPAPKQALEFTIAYSDTDIRLAIEDTLALYYWDSEQWIEEPTSILDSKLDVISATPNHLSVWSVLGETIRLFLPITERY